MINHGAHCSNHTNLMVIIISIMLILMIIMVVMVMMMIMMMVKYIFHILIFKKSLGEQLFDAAKSGDVEAIERLLDEGADIEYIGLVREVIIIYLLIYFLLDKWSILCI